MYIKENNTLYRRYIPSGLRLRGNPAILAITTNIRRGNPDILVYGNWGLARAAHPDAMVDKLSQEHMGKTKADEL